MAADPYSATRNVVEHQLALIEAAADKSAWTNLQPIAWRIIERLLAGELWSVVVDDMRPVEGRDEFSTVARAAGSIASHLHVLSSDDPTGAERLTAEVKNRLSDPS